MAEDRQNKELNTFGFTGKLRTGLVTAIIAIQFGTIAVLWNDNRNQSKEMSSMQDRLYQQMIKEIKGEVKSEVGRTVTPTTQRLDTVANKLDRATTQLQQKMNVK
ncbi:hypothetical protein QT327_10605 [Olivibacter sp. 47]|uniref:hypothetical protein n=1 Tax=Olivibacter sp. 47 TaxID=3056486 RepID=UPI0025A406BF|nr:hypothetical protein [Olivibacter sp. 47]MDM8174800.1 hypothetical protein [Olivibacter sp. 47]